MAEVVGGELPLKAVLGFLALGHGRDARVQEKNVDQLTLVSPPGGKLPDRGGAGGGRGGAPPPRARMNAPDRIHRGLRLRFVARRENDLRASPGEGQSGL